MSDSNALDGEVWRRGARLGMIWLAGFVIAGVLLYALMGVLGWSGTARALCAMLVAPVLGISGIALWWLARRPMLAPPKEEEETEQDEETL